MTEKSLAIVSMSLFLASVALGATEVTESVDFIPGAYPENSQPDGNSVLLSGASGAIVIDTGRHPEHTRKIIALAHARHEEIAAVINTHWHLDHIAGNAMIRRAYPNVKIYATRALSDALNGFLRDYQQQLQHALTATHDEATLRTYRSELAIIESAPALASDITLNDATTLKVAGRSLDVHVEHAVTAGDIWLIDRHSQVAIVGDLVTLPVPFFDTACPERWSEALRHVAGSSFEKLIPGHGEPMTRQAFEKYRRAFDILLQCAASTESVNNCSAQWRGELGSLIQAEPRRVNSMFDYYFKNNLRASAAKEKYCAAL